MPPTGPALMVARLGVMRLGASRLGYYQPFLKFTVNGVDRSTGSYLRIEDLQIVDYLDGQPNIATMRLHRFTPVKGQEVKLGLGGLGVSQLIFAGHIQTLKQVYEADRPVNTAWDATCISYEWLLNRRKVSKRYISESATDIAHDLIATFTSGFTSLNVEPGLSSLDEFTLTDEDVTDALDRLAKRIGGYWFIDYGRDLHFFTTAAESVHDITTASPKTAREIFYESDLTPVRTRVIVEGRGTTALAERLPGDTTIPVEDQAWADPAGGTFKSGPQHITYTGVSAVAGTGTTVAGTLLSPSAPTAAVMALVKKTVSSITRSSTTATVTTSSAHGWSTGYRVTIRGAEQSEYNGTVTITVTGSTTFTYEVSGSPATPATGSIDANRGDGNLQVGQYRYKVAFETSAGLSEAGTASSPVTIAPVTPPEGTDITLDGDITGEGQLTPESTYRYRLTYVDSRGGETSSNNAEDVILSDLETAVNLTTIPVSTDPRVVKRRLYRSVDAEDLSAFLLRLEMDNVTTDFWDRRSDISLGERTLPLSNTTTGGQVEVTLPIGPDGTEARILYRTEVDSTAEYKRVARIADNSTTLYFDNVKDESLGAAAPTESQVGALPGATVLRVADTAVVDASGGWAYVGSQLIRFTGRSVASGEGNLTGIPASGDGSIGADVLFGTAVVNAPLLVGIPASGAGAILYRMAAGDELNLIVTRNDSAAQTAMAALVGGDGIHEEYIQDRRISQAEAESRGDAKLLEVSGPVVAVTYQTRDKTTKSGREVTFSLSAPTNLSGTFKIQQVTITDFDPYGERWPLRTVMASSRRESFESWLRILKRQAA